MKILNYFKKILAELGLYVCQMIIIILLIFVAACSVVVLGVLYILERISSHLQSLIDGTD